ncbi:MAG: hypothetical protein EAZ58_13395, partial [Flavobacterium sp.]
GNVAQTATVTVNGSGGTAPYEYSFDNGTSYSSTNTYQSTVGITFDVLVKDAKECVYTLSNGVNIPALDAPTDMDINGTPVFCAPAASTSSTVTISNIQDGIAPFTYQIISPIAAIINNGTNAVFTGLTPDTYVFQVTDTNGCTYQESYTVAPVTPIAIVGALVNDISCDAANGTTNNGSASFTVTGFSASGNYSITTSPVVPAAQISNVNDVITLTGLSAGMYTVTVTDITTGCTANDAVTIALPAPIVFTATPSKVFCSQDISTITVSGVAGGTGTYTYAVVTGGAPAPAVGAYSTSAILIVDTNLTALSWDVYVKDANGCIAMQNVTVVSDAAPTIVAPAVQCYVGTSLTTDLDAVTTTYNGTKSYTVDGIAIATSIATLSAPGTYVLGIKDDNGCEAFVNYTILPQLTLQANLTLDLTCPNPASVTLVPAGGTTSYTLFEVDNGTGYVTTTNPFTTTIAGTYKFRVTDSQGCQAESQDVIVTPNTTPTA